MIVRSLPIVICPLVSETVSAGIVIVSPGFAAATAARNDPEPLSLPSVTATGAACAGEPQASATNIATNTPERSLGVTRRVHTSTRQKKPFHEPRRRPAVVELAEAFAPSPVALRVRRRVEVT
jgi:hypothetical protein